MRVVFLIPLTIILTWFYNRSGSIQATALFHSSMNTVPFVLPYFPPAWELVFVWAAYAVTAERMWQQSFKNQLAEATPARSTHQFQIAFRSPQHRAQLRLLPFRDGYFE